MKNPTITLITASFMWTYTLAAQQIQEPKQMYGMVKDNVLRLAEKMPEENYSFKPTPEIRSFGQLVAHVADAQARFCSTVLGSPKSINAASKESKADLVAALKDSIAICDSAWDSLTPSNASENVKMGQMQRSKLGLLEGNSLHINEEYGYMAVYLRLKGVVPPSSGN